MQKKSDGNSDFSMEQAMKMAQSDAGKELFALLQSTQGDRLRTAMDQAASGDMDQVKKTMEEIMASRQAQELFARMRGDSNG
jgi:hypothetical protein